MTLKVPGYAVILSNVTSSGNTAFWTTSSRVYRFYFTGTFGRATVKLQARVPEGDWVDIPNTTLFDEGYLDAPILRSADYRVVVAGATGTTSISCIALQCYRPDIYMEAEQFLVPSLSPSQLFANGEQGMWYDLNDLSTLFTDSAGTTPATWGDPIGLQLDKHDGLAQGANLSPDAGNPYTVTTGFESHLATASVVGGKLRVTTTDVFGRVGTVAFTTVVGTHYVVSVPLEYVSGTNDGWYLQKSDSAISLAAVNGAGTSATASAAITKTLFFTATATTSYLRVVNTTAGRACEFSTISIRSIAGNHRIQSTAGSRPILGRMPKRGAVNQLLYTTEYRNAQSGGYWGNTRCTVDAGIDGHKGALNAFRITNTETLGGVVAVNVAVTGSHAWQWKVRAGTATWCVVRTATAATPITTVEQWVNLSTGVAGGSTGSPGTVTITAAGNGYWLITVSSSGARNRLALYCVDDNNSLDCTIGRYIDFEEVQLEAGLVATAYQRVGATAFDVTESGQPSCGYLSYNGSNQWMQTASAVDFSATDEMSVFVAARKIVDTPAGAFLEALTATTGGRVTVFIPTGLNANSVANTVRSSTGNNSSVSAAGTMPVLTNKVITLIADLSAPLLTQRVNGVQSATSTDALGGNLGNIVRYFGATGGTSFFFNGLEFSTIIRGATTSGTLLTRTEQYVARQTPTVNL